MYFLPRVMWAHCSRQRGVASHAKIRPIVVVNKHRGCVQSAHARSGFLSRVSSMLQGEMKMNANAGFCMQSTRTVLAAAALILCLSAASLAQENHPSKHYVLPATPENVQWGWYDV